MPQIVTFLVAHWVLCVFCQTFFLHRYGAHRMFTMHKGWERFFHALTFLSQGSSYLNPKAYAYLHRLHHAFSDTERDPHSPHVNTNFIKMMYVTKQRYDAFNRGVEVPEERFRGETPEWPLLDRFGRTWTSHFLFMGLYTWFYVVYAPHWGYYFLLPVHFVMGPIHGAIVNWCGHKYGYRNFDTTKDDRSKNTLVFDFVTMGELFQNNHHKFGMSPNFAARWFELDPTYPVIRLLAWLKVIDLGPAPQLIRYPAPDVA